MKYMKILPFLFLAMMVFSCEKASFAEEDEDELPNILGGGYSDSTGWDDDDPNWKKKYDDPNIKDGNGNTGKYKTGDVVTVTEFLEDTINCGVWIEGYIVGACTKSFSYAEFTAPFTYSQAVLLAAKKSERSKKRLMSVQLQANSYIRRDLNLVDHPENFNRPVAIFGYQGDTYLGIPGIKSNMIGAYKFLN